MHLPAVECSNQTDLSFPPVWVFVPQGSEEHLTCLWAFRLTAPSLPAVSKTISSLQTWLWKAEAAVCQLLEMMAACTAWCCLMTSGLCSWKHQDSPPTNTISLLIILNYFCRHKTVKLQPIKFRESWKSPGNDSAVTFFCCKVSVIQGTRSSKAPTSVNSGSIWLQLRALWGL